MYPVGEGCQPGVDRGDVLVTGGGTEGDNPHLVPGAVLLAVADQRTSTVTVAGGGSLSPGTLHALLDSEARPLLVYLLALILRQEEQAGLPQSPGLAIEISWEVLIVSCPAPPRQEARHAGWEGAGVSIISL